MPVLKIEVVSGEIQIIRKELSPAELYPLNQRFEDGTMQYTPDGGATWIDAPELDPRNQTGIPPRSGSDVPCQSAGSVAEYIKRFINIVVPLILASATVAQGASTIVGVLGLISGAYSALWSLITGLFASLASLGGTTISNAFDSAVYHEIACILTCHMDANGQVDQARLDNAMAQITADIGGTAATVTNLILSIMGFAGVNKAASFYSVDEDCGDCSNCSWCYTFDFTVDPNLFQAGPGLNATSWIPGQGFAGGTINAGSVADVTIHRDFSPPLSLTSATMVYTKTAGSGVNNVNTLRLENPIGTTVAQNGGNGTGTGVSKTVTYTGDVSRIYVDINSGNSAATVRVLSITLRGTGDNPFGADNC